MKFKFIATSILVALGTSNVQSDETIVVTANRIPQNINDVLADIEVIEREEIERLQPQSFVDLLENVAGIDAITRGGHGQTSSIFVRGASSSQTLILVNGVRVGSATLGEKALSTIVISQIERIEIVRGPRAAVWGSDAIGGVIQIFTRKFESGEHKVTVTKGSNGTSKRELSAGFGSEAFTNTFTYAMNETDGIDAREGFGDDKDGSSQESYALRGDYSIAQGHDLNWLLQKDRSIGHFDSSFGGNATRSNIELYHIDYAVDIAGWSSLFTFSQSVDESVTFDDAIGYSGADAFVTEKTQASAVSEKPLSDAFNLTLGFDWYQDDIAKTTTVYADEKRSTESFFAGVNYREGNMLADVTIRQDDVENIDSRTTTNAGVGYQFNNNQTLILNYSEGFKAPSFNDLYYPFGGNPDLKFETSDTMELIYKLSWEQWNLSAIVYDSNIDNLIQWMPGDNGIWAPENVGQVVITGYTFDLSFQQEAYKHNFNLSTTEPEDKVSGEQLIRRSRIQASYDFAYSGDVFDWSLQINHVGSRPDTTIDLPAYTRINLSTGFEFNENWRVKLKVNDLLDKAPTIVSGYNPIGRELHLTIVYKNLN